ncbi:MAG: phosphoenolpyruvate synthase [Firmicutes bacterium]|nr:phosphoenolpyruvate synthase [Bacillota bacterium]
MKAENLRILQQNKFKVPPFITVESCDNIALSFSKAETFAVRSSFGNEDGAEHSFAGQYKTILNVGRKDVPSAVGEVFKSLDNASDYVKAKGIKQTKGCVIIQEMINADFSGVIFTADPQGILNEIAVTFGKGTGDRIVNDSSETNTCFYNKDDCLWYGGNELPPKKFLDEIVLLSKKAEEIFGTYVDMEFAVKDDILYILQARPITTLPSRNIILLDSSNISESYPDITLPLTQSFVDEIYYRIFEGCLKRLSKDDRLVTQMQPYLKNMTKSVNGREYYVISNWYAFLSLLPFSKRITKIWQEMLGVENKDISAPKIKTNFIQKAKMFGSFMYYLFTTPKHMARLKVFFDKKYPEYQRLIKSAKDSLSVYDKITTEILSVWDITLINDMYAFIFTHLSRKGKRLGEISPESMKPALALNSLIKTYKKYGLESREYKAKKERYIALYGDRVSGELKLETPTYRTDPQLLDAYVKTHEPSNISPSKKTYFFAPFLKRAVKGIENRELSRLDRSRIFGLVREIMLKTGEEFVKRGIIETREDIFYLYLKEIRNISSFSKEYTKNTLSERKAKYNALEALPYFRRLVFADKITEKNFFSASVSVSENTLYGTPTSGGKVTGEVLVIDRPENADTRGKIIVTRFTDPGWIFIIQNCKGMIAERGSLLSHTAIISRELKKPAVVNVKNASRLLKTGMCVELDADKGRIRIL